MTPSGDQRERWQVLKAIFSEALEIEDPAARTAYLELACAGDPDLLFQVGRMLAIQVESNLAVDRAPLGGLALGSLIPEPLNEGQLVAGRFRIVRRLGAGGMGEVYEASDTALGQTRLALKTIRPDHASQPPYISRFKQELQLLRQITHPNVCRVFDFVPGDGPGEPSFFTMELVEGETLAARLQSQGPLTHSEAADVFGQILRGLDAAHATGVIHRDLKPANIMLAPSAEGGLRVVLMDFGIAHGSRHNQSTGETAQTLDAILGTPAYMAPEQLQGLAVSPASDVYAFGVVAYEALTGTAPFTGATPLAIIARKLATAPGKIVEAGLGIPASWRGLIARCMAHEPAQRFATARAVRKELEETASSGLRGRIAWPWSGTSRSWWITRRAILAPILLLVIVAAVFWLWRSQQPSGEARRLYTQGVTAVADASFLRASRLFDAVIERDPGYALAHARRAQALSALDSPDLARESLLRAMELRNGSFVPLLSTYERHVFDAIRATVTRDFATAAERFAQAAVKAPAGERLPALLDLGAAQESAGRTEPATKTYWQAEQLEPSHPTAQLRLGTLAARRSDLPAALASFDRALRGYELTGNSEGIAETWIRRGQAYTRLSRYPEAREAMETGRRYAESNRLASHNVRALFGLSSIAVGSGDMADARRLAEQALALARSEKQESQIISAMNDLANAHLAQLKLKETGYLARQSLELAERYRQPQSAARARLLLMNTLYYGGGAGTLDEARQLGNQALDYYKQAGDPRGHVDVLLMLGRLENKSDRFAAALPIFEEASKAAKKMDDPQSIGLAEQGLAASSQALGQLPQSAGHAHRAAEAYRQSKRSGSLAYALMAEGEQRLELGQPEGEKILEEAARMAAKNPRLLASIALVRADYRASQGDLDAAGRLFRQAAAFTEDESPDWRARLAATEARLLAPTANRPRAIALCRKALQLADDGLAFDLRSAVLLSCASTLGTAGRFLAPALTRLAATAAASGNHATAWRAWQSIIAVDPTAKSGAERQSARHWSELKSLWGEAAAHSYAATWTRSISK